MGAPDADEATGGAGTPAGTGGSGTGGASTGGSAGTPDAAPAEGTGGAATGGSGPTPDADIAAGDAAAATGGGMLGFYEAEAVMPAGPNQLLAPAVISNWLGPAGRPSSLTLAPAISARSGGSAAGSIALRSACSRIGRSAA